MHPTPILAVEVLSNSTERLDRGQKMQDYAAYGVEEYLLINPIKQTLEQYLLNGQTFKLAHQLGAESVYESKAIAGFKVEMGVMFG